MAKLTVKTDVPLSPQDTWDKASNLRDFDKWFVVHDGWRGELPETLTAGTEISSVVTVKGLRNRVKWTIKEYDAPHRIVLKGDGKGGVKLGLVLDVQAKGGASEVAFTIELGGAPLFGPIGSGVAKALKGDIEKSLQTFVELYA
ncbi:SRPBCC family protein [Rhodococcus sp. ACS1]|uniref:Polyketide cyclase / dehydrase and lipid transport n=1 Tax=Rhodococcus koreensis TaxID=99653 RepID=A0A1H4S558_9NOCA|nr:MULTISPECIES: SRPBCC family protein [Rhodococcus]PBC46706.1 SRPBCC family protein [Rhodococcus sp. ACS1]QSE82692.1 SRPBCC family protein [Rhodococcus koreensis]SEC39001.1 Polyketide cyclase / dehydrase and lipid transport [Rhodococcus koreensis]